MRATAIDVVVVAYGEEPLLDSCLRAILASEGVAVQIALVDNGCRRTDLDTLCADARVDLIRAGSNLGFAGGCNVGAVAHDAPIIAFINSDAIVHPSALCELAAGLTPGVGLTTACVLLADDERTVNSAGNPMHFLGISWAGGYGDPDDRHQQEREVLSVSGAAAAITRCLWQQLGGFESSLFMYCEDQDLSLRVWQRGLRVKYVPSARVWHHYEFSKNPEKWYLLERNRLFVVLTLYQTRTLVLLAPALVALEVTLCLVAVAEGRLRAKLRGYTWLVQHRTFVLRRRRYQQHVRLMDDRAVAPHLEGTLDSPLLRGPLIDVGNRVLAAYWNVVQLWL